MSIAKTSRPHWEWTREELETERNKIVRDNCIAAVVEGISEIIAQKGTIGGLWLDFTPAITMRNLQEEVMKVFRDKGYTVSRHVTPPPNYNDRLCINQA